MNESVNSWGRPMKRRDLLAAGLAMTGAAAFDIPSARGAVSSRVRPGQAAWPSAADWASLGDAVGGRLAPVAMPDLADPAVRKLLADPFYIADQPALTESSGWLD